MDKKEVRLTILASAILVGVPLIANAIHDLLSGRWDEHLGRRRPSDPADAGDAAPHLRKAGRTAGRRSTPAAGGGGDRPAAFGDSSTGEPGRIRPAVNAGLPDVERPTRA
jgi:hypothetical protein